MLLIGDLKNPYNYFSCKKSDTKSINYLKLNGKILNVQNITLKFLFHTPERF